MPSIAAWVCCGCTISIRAENETRPGPGSDGAVPMPGSRDRCRVNSFLDLRLGVSASLLRPRSHTLVGCAPDCAGRSGPARILRPLCSRWVRNARAGFAGPAPGGQRVLPLRAKSHVYCCGVDHYWPGTAAGKRVSAALCRSGLGRFPWVRFVVRRTQAAEDLRGGIRRVLCSSPALGASRDTLKISDSFLVEC